MQKTRVDYFESDEPQKLEDEINEFCDNANFNLINVSYSTYVNKENDTVFHSALVAYTYDTDYQEQYLDEKIDPAGLFN